MTLDHRKYIDANPWEVVNLASIGTVCGRFPTQEAALAHGETYRGGVEFVDHNIKRVDVYDIPSL